MRDPIITGNDDETAAAEIQHHAERRGWGGVRPDTQVRVQFRDTMRDAIVQKRGAFFFAYTMGDDGRAHTTGPVRSRVDGARQVIAASKSADHEAV